MLRTFITFITLALMLASCQPEYPQAIRPEGNDEGNKDEIPEQIVTADVTVTIDPSSDNGNISNMLTGVNLLYCFEKDALWAGDPDHKIMNYLKSMKTGVLRYPGGKIVEGWHWDNPNGMFAYDSWKDGYDESKAKDPSEFMDLAEYMEVVKELNAEPLVGINITSGKKWKNDVALSLDETRRLVQHCVDMNYHVKYYYIGNEPYHTGATLTLSPEEYGDEINRFSAVIHEVDPNAKIVANWDRNVTSTAMAKLLNRAGKNIDVMEIHWYWSWGTASWDLWKNQIPMSAKNQYYTGGQPHFGEVQKFNDFAAKLGCSHIKFASLEWNIAPSANEQSVPNEYQMALMQSEMLMQFMEGGLLMATFWPLHYETSSDMRYMLDASDGYKPRNTLDVFSMLSSLQGGKLLSRTSTSKEMYSIAAEFPDGKIRVALLNKNMAARNCALYFNEDFSGKKVAVECYSENKVDGKAVISKDIVPEFSRGRIIVELPAYSLAVLTIG